MNISGLRERVRLAQEHEQNEIALRSWLGQRLPELHQSIVIEGDGVETLFNFIRCYIEHVPDVIEAAESVAETATLRTQLLPVLKVAEAFFLHPPDLPADHQGMLALLDEAYLAHRLVEEVNDRYVVNGGEQLIPMDITRANLIVHHLLGEPFANELDAAVDDAVRGLVPDSLFSSPPFRDYQSRIDPAMRRELWQQWPCMSQTLGVGIRWRDAV